MGLWEEPRASVKEEEEEEAWAGNLSYGRPSGQNHTAGKERPVSDVLHTQCCYIHRDLAATSFTQTAIGKKIEPGDRHFKQSFFCFQIKPETSVSCKASGTSFGRSCRGGRPSGDRARLQGSTESSTNRSADYIGCNHNCICKHPRVVFLLSSVYQLLVGGYFQCILRLLDEA